MLNHKKEYINQSNFLLKIAVYVRRELDGGDYLRLYQHPLEEEIYLKI